MLLAKLGKTLKGKRTGRLELTVSSTDRAFGTLFGAEITRQCGDSLPDDSYVITCHGGGGQSFGAFIPKGLTLELEGDCNDGLGKGLSGGKLVLYPPKDSTFDPGENIIVGNVALYGATSGQAFINGMAGERFCVRNSGAIAVVEGVGDHGCEYMTGGRCVILGPTGKNFAAGMSGGIAYVLDEKHDLYMRLNKDQVMTDTLTEPHDIAELRSLIEAHVAATGSPRGPLLQEGHAPGLRPDAPVHRPVRGERHDPSAGGDRGVLRQYQSLRGGWTTWENPPAFWNIPAGRMAAGPRRSGSGTGRSSTFPCRRRSGASRAPGA